MKKRISTFLFNLTLLCGGQAAAQEWVISAGIETHQSEFDTLDPVIDASQPTDQGLYFSSAIRKSFGSSQKHKLGFALDLSGVNGDRMTGFRALDYQYQLIERWRLGGFFGVASVDSGLPQNGYYLGLNTTFFPSASKNWSLNLELSHGNGLGRDRREEAFDDPACGDDCRQPDIFLDFYRAAFTFSYYFK